MAKLKPIEIEFDVEIREMRRASSLRVQVIIEDEVENSRTTLLFPRVKNLVQSEAQRVREHDPLGRTFFLPPTVEIHDMNFSFEAHRDSGNMFYSEVYKRTLLGRT